MQAKGTTCDLSSQQFIVTTKTSIKALMGMEKEIFLKDTGWMTEQ